MRFKTVISTALALALAASLSLSGCGESKKLIRMSHTQQESHPVHTGLLAFEKYLEERLGEKYDVQIFPNSILGANEKVLELVRQGAVQYVVISTANIEALDKLYAVFSIPYVFPNEQVFEKFITSAEVITRLGANSAADGFTPVTAFTAGTRNFYATQPINSAADLAGKKFRVQAGPITVEMMTKFGAAATPMSFGEVYAALQQQLIDGAENNELALVDQKHGEFTKYYSYDMHQMLPDMLMISNQFLASLPAEERQIFADAAQSAQQAEFEAWRSRISAAREEALKMGVTFIEVDVSEFRNTVLSMHRDILEKNPDLRELYNIIATYSK